MYLLLQLVEVNCPSNNHESSLACSGRAPKLELNAPGVGLLLTFAGGFVLAISLIDYQKIL